MRAVLASLFALALFAPVAGTQETEQEAELVEEHWPGGGPKCAREVVRDDAGREVNHGQYKSWHENGELAETGKYKDGLRVGKWETFHANGTLASSGIYRRGFRILKWLYQDENGKRLGESGRYAPEFEEYEGGALKSGGERRGKVRHGFWSWWYEDGGVACEGRYRLDERDGPWAWYYPDGAPRLEGSYERGERVGEWTFHHPNGYADPDFLSGLYEDGERVGPNPALPVEPPAIDLATLPEPRPSELLTSTNEEILAALVRVAENGAEEAVSSLSEWEYLALPVVLERWKEPGVAEAAGQRLADLAARAVGGHGFGGPDDPGELRRALLRWSTLWELACDDEAFWEKLRRAKPMTGTAFLEWLAANLEVGTFGAKAAAPAVPEVEIAARSELLDRNGGQGTERALDAALEWLVAHQGADGRWDPRRFEELCGGEHPCGGVGNPFQSVGVTGLALLALLGAGNDFDDEVQEGGSDAVRAGTEWLRRQFDGSTGILGEENHHDHVYGHAIGTAALCEVYRGRNDPLLRKVIRACVDTILRTRNADGGWRYSKGNETSDTSVTSWQLMALSAAKRAGIEVPDRAIPEAIRWIDAATDPETGRVGYDSRGSQSSRTPVNEDYDRTQAEAMTAAGLWCRLLAGEDPERSGTVEQHVALLLERPPLWQPELRANDMYYWYYGTYAMFQIGGKPWKRWNDALRAALLESQSRLGHAKGSWDPIGPWGYAGGRVYATALAALCLEVYYRYPRGFGR